MLGGALSSWAYGNSQLANNALTDEGVVDLRNTTVQPATITDFVTSPATTVIFPDSWTAAEVKTAGENLKNSSISFGTAVSTTNSSETNPVTRYYYTNDGGDRVYVANNWQNPIEVTFNETFSISDGTLELDRSYSAYINNITNQEVEVDLNDDNISDGYYYPDEIQNVQLTPYALDGNGNEVSGWSPFLNNNTNTYYCNTNSGQLEINAWKYQYNGNWITYPGVPVINEWGGISPVTIDNSDRSISFKVDTYYVYSYTNGKNEPKTTTSTVELTEFSDSYQKQYYLTTEEVHVPTWTKLYSYVNTPGTLDNAIADATIFPNVTTQVTIFGNINNDDLTTLNAANFSIAEVVNLSGATMAAGSSITSLDSKATALIILPSTPTTQELGQIMAHQVAADNSQYYSCLAYYNGENRLTVFAQDGNVAKIAPFVTTSTAVYSLPHYDTSGNIDYYAGSRGGNLTDYVNAFTNIPAAFVDFGYVDVNLNCNFTNLNDNTASIRVPMNGTGYDITNVGNKADFAGYTFDNDIKLVSFYVASGVTATINGKTVNTGTTKESTNVVMVRESGALDTYHNYLSAEQLNATRQIILTDPNVTGVELTAADIAELSDCVSDKIDLVDANVSAENVASLANGTVKYLALPGSAASTIAGTENACAYSTSTKCPQLYCVGALNPTTKSFTAWAKQNLDDNDVQVPSLYLVTEMINQNTSIENLTLSGYYCRKDIKTGATTYTKEGLIGATIKTADLTNAVFAPNSEMVLSMAHDDTSHPGASWGSLTSVLLPTSSSQKVLPANCLNNTASLKSLCIPSNYETIGEYALYGCGATCIYTTEHEGDDFRDDVNVYNHGEFTITLSSNLKHIETGAFCTGNEKWTDVYSLAKDAPTCAAGAFNSMNTYADNTYAGLDAHPVERANYKKSETQLMTVLHYPVTCSETEAKQYTDIKRKYSLIDETGAYDGEGNLMRWPNQSEFMRSYNQAVAGLTWDTWSDARVPVGQPTANELFDSGLYGASYAYQGTTYVTEAETSNDYHISTGWNGQILETYTPSFTIDNDNVYDYNNYMGWHQFVLCQSVSVDRIVPKDPTTYVQGDWYTLCLPYDLTREQVLSLIGIPANEDVTYAAAKGYQAEDGSWFPQVYTLTGVTRHYPTITLTFSQELMKRLEKGKGDITFNDAESTTANSPATYKSAYDYSEEETNGQTAAGSNKIYLKGGFPYLVRPILPAGTTIDGTLGQYMLKVGSFNKTNLGHQATVTKGNGTANGKIAAPIVNQKFIARNGTEKIDFKVDEETTSKYYYYFVGTYTEEMIPAYAYHLSGGSWSRTEDESKTWQPFTAIIGGKCTDEGAVYETDNPNSDGTNGLTTYYVSLKNQDDNFVTAGQHNIQYLITFEDEEGEGEVVAIDKIDGRDINNAISAEGNVYNMTGQFVGNSLNGLAKGVYLVNGKKVLVK